LKKTEDGGVTGSMRPRRDTVFVLSITLLLQIIQHMLVVGTGEMTIPKSLQLIAGRTAQKFNIRKKRKGAFWGDRYHATAVETDKHLVKCLVYIDLNMVRAGVVQHPSEYSISGYNEIQNPPERYSILNRKAQQDHLAIHKERRFRLTHREWVESELKNGSSVKNPLWSESVAVGKESFIKGIKQKLASRAQGRSIVFNNETIALKESQAPYSTLLASKKEVLSLNNTYFLPTSC
jgi:putative transposase